MPAFTDWAQTGAATDAARIAAAKYLYRMLYQTSTEV
jgi:hypothetical protein